MRSPLGGHSQCSNPPDREERRRGKGGERGGGRSEGGVREGGVREGGEGRRRGRMILGKGV